MMMATAEPTSNHNEAIDLSLIKKEISDDVVPKMNGDSSNDEKLLFASMFEQQVTIWSTEQPMKMCFASSSLDLEAFITVLC